MADYNYLKPKVNAGNLSKRKREDGQFVNVDSYTKLGGFTSVDKLPNQEPAMSLEKGGPSAKSGKPI